MKEVNRRDFIKTVAIGGAVLGLGNAIVQRPLEAVASGKYDIGQCKSVKVKCVSELGWYDDKQIVKDMKDAGGFRTNQWIIYTLEDNCNSIRTIIRILPCNQIIQSRTK